MEKKKGKPPLGLAEATPSLACLPTPAAQRPLLPTAAQSAGRPSSSGASHQPLPPLTANRAPRVSLLSLTFLLLPPPGRKQGDFPPRFKPESRDSLPFPWKQTCLKASSLGRNPFPSNRDAKACPRCSSRLVGISPQAERVAARRELLPSFFGPSKAPP